MSTLRSDRTKRLRTARRYALLAAFCAVFSTVYEAFSHGVWSWWMVLLGLWPLLGGGVPYLLSALRGGKRAHWLARWCHGACLAVCMAGSTLRGVMDIYGTRSDLLSVYPAAALGLLAASVICLRLPDKPA